MYSPNLPHIPHRGFSGLTFYTVIERHFERDTGKEIEIPRSY